MKATDTNISFLTLLLIVSVLLSGCWSSIELHDRAFVNIIFFDKVKEGYSMTLGFPLPNRLIPGETGGGGGMKKPYSYVTKNGKNISEAYQNIQVDMSRTISFGQTRVIVISEKLASESTSPVLEFLLREPSLHINANVFLVKGNEVLLEQTPMVFERFVNDLLESYTQRHSTLDTTVKDFLTSKYNGGDQLVPIIDFSSQPVDQTEKKRWLGTDGAGIMKKGKLLKPKLTSNDTRAALWIDSKVNDLVETIQSPLDKKDISFVVPSAKTQITPHYEQGKLDIEVSSKARGFVLASDSKINLLDADILEELEKLVNEKIKRDIEETIMKVRKTKSDAFDFGGYVDCKYPRLWDDLKEDWREYYSKELQVHVKVDIQIKRTGTAQKSVTDQFHLKMGK